MGRRHNEKATSGAACETACMSTPPTPLKVRLRLINASADTIFALALGDHDLSVTHSDGFAVEPVTAKALYLGMGERYDVVVTVKDGMFPLVARPVGKTSGGQGLAVRMADDPGPPSGRRSRASSR